MLNLLNPKGIALILAAGYFLSKKKVADNASAEVLPAYLTPPTPATMPVSLAVPVKLDEPAVVPAAVSQPIAPAFAVNEPAPTSALPAPVPTQVAVVEDPRIAKRIEVAKKYGADPSQLDLNQPEIEYWDAVNNVIHRQPNYIYKANQLSLPVESPRPVQSISLVNPTVANTVKFGSFRRMR